MINVADIMSGYGGYSIGVEQTKNARVVLAIEKDPNTAEVYAKNFPHHPLRVQELGGNSRSLVAELRQIPRLLLHCSPPCQSLSQHAGQPDDERHCGWSPSREVVPPAG